MLLEEANVSEVKNRAGNHRRFRFNTCNANNDAWQPPANSTSKTETMPYCMLRKQYATI